MTRTELVEWVVAYGCRPEPFKGMNITGNAVKFVNTATGAYTHIYTPIDDREVADYIIYRVCVKLGIPVPDCAKDQSRLDDDLRNRLGNH